MVNLIGAVVFMMFHDNIYDVSSIFQITFSSFLVICAIYYSEKLMKESYLQFKQNEKLNHDFSNLLLNLPQPLLLLDENNQEAVLANKELYKLLSINQDQGSVAISSRLSQKILEPYNYIEGLGDEEENSDSNISNANNLSESTVNSQQKYDLYETIQNNQPDSYYSLDTTHLFEEDIPLQQRKNPRNLNFNQSKKIDDLENKIQQKIGTSLLNPEQAYTKEQGSAQSQDSKCKNKIYKEIVYIKVQNLHFQHRDLKMIVLHRITSFVNYEKLKMDNNFIEMITATVSHDMRTPINSIQGLIQSLEKFIPQYEGQKVLSVIKNSSKILLYLVNDILDYFQIKHGIFKAKTLNSNIQNTVNELIDMFQLFAFEKKILLKAEFDRSLPLHLYTDNQRIQQVLINLLQNALKFTIQGSIKILVSYNKIDELINFKVIDTGVGVQPVDQKRLFKLFGKFDNQLVVNTKGIGLGLNICKKVVKECGGNIYLESSYKLGASFCFCMKAVQVKKDENFHDQKQIEQTSKLTTPTKSDYNGLSLVSKKLLSCEQEQDLQIISSQNKEDLSVCSLDLTMLSPLKRTDFNPYIIETQCPHSALFLHESESENIQDQAPSTCDCKTKPRILIVDDNVFNLILEMQFNLQVDKATNGLEGVEKVIERYKLTQSSTRQCSCNYNTTDSQCQKNSQEIYKVIFMDCNMPIMDGFEATKQIRKLQNIDQSDMKIIALTANTNQSLQDQCFESGMDQFLSKPLESHLLKEVLIDNGLYYD
eukprot:403366078